MLDHVSAVFLGLGAGSFTFRSPDWVSLRGVQGASLLPRHLDRPGDCWFSLRTARAGLDAIGSNTGRSLSAARVVRAVHGVYFILRLLRLRAGALGAVLLIIREKSQ